jgi:two-component system, chemotaxis family, sensor kinase CheA
MNPDMTQYMDVFLDEGREQLALLEANVLQMELGNHTSDMLQTLFRAAHTLKGSSRAMGFLAIGDLTHEMENILDALRGNKLEVTTPIVNVLLDCLDTLSSLVEAVGQTGNDQGVENVDIPKLVNRLNAERTGQSVEAMAVQQSAPATATDREQNTAVFVLEKHELDSIEAALDSGLKVYEIALSVSPDCVLKSIRAWMMLAALEKHGNVLAANPSIAQIEADEFDLAFNLMFASEVEAAQIAVDISAISEIELISICETHQTETEAPPEIITAIQTQVAEISVPSVLPNVTSPKERAGTSGDHPPAQSDKPTSAPTIRVEVSRLDSLLNLVGELVIDRAQMHRIGAELHRRYPHDEESSQLLETVHRITRITGELQDQIMKARLLPINGVFQRLPRMVRDLAQKTGKELNFEMSGGETELDRTVLEVLSDPLIHLLRNSVDHGIEPPDERLKANKPQTGTVVLAARHEENHIIIDITDDGRGMDPARLKESAIRKGMLTEAAAAVMTDRDALSLIFGSGFSTAATLTDISGRGVGMDIVRSNLEKVGGRILVESSVGLGSRFSIHLPLTLAIVRAVLVKAGGTYVLPIGSVVEMLQLGQNDGETPLRTLSGRAVIDLRGTTVPLVSLAELLCGNPEACLPSTIASDSYIVVVGVGEKQVGLCVEALIGEQEVVIKSIGMLLGEIEGLSGATILGDGRVALIVDVARAVDNIGRIHEHAHAA